MRAWNLAAGLAVIGAVALGAATPLQQVEARVKNIERQLAALFTFQNDTTPPVDIRVETTVGGSVVSGVKILSSDVPCAVSASYCAIWTIPGSGITASRALFIEAHLIVDSDSTTVAPQFRVRSADTGYTGNCEWKMHEAGTSTTADEADIEPIAAAPADTGGTTWFSTAPQPVMLDCALLSDATPGDIIIEFQLETGTTPTQNVLRGSYYSVTQ